MNKPSKLKEFFASFGPVLVVLVVAVVVTFAINFATGFGPGQEFAPGGENAVGKPTDSADTGSTETTQKVGEVNGDGEAGIVSDDGTDGGLDISGGADGSGQVSFDEQGNPVQQYGTDSSDQSNQ